jgi:hypothetical protein
MYPHYNLIYYLLTYIICILYFYIVNNLLFDYLTKIQNIYKIKLSYTVLKIFSKYFILLIISYFMIQCMLGRNRDTYFWHEV